MLLRLHAVVVDEVDNLLRQCCATLPPMQATKLEQDEKRSEVRQGGTSEGER